MPYWDSAPVNGWVRGEGVEDFQAPRQGFLVGAVDVWFAAEAAP